MAPSSGPAVSVLDAMSKATIEKHTANAGPKPTLTTLLGENNGPSIIRPAALPRTPAPFPFDQPGPELLVVIAGLEAQRATLTSIIDALRLLAGDPEQVAGAIATDKATTTALLEKEADRRIAEGAPTVEAYVKEVAEARDAKRAAVLEALIDADEAESFQERLARLGREAQDSLPGVLGTTPEVYAGTDENGEDVWVPEGWTCPRHPTVKPTTKTSARRNRDYLACSVPGCGKFETL